MAHGLHVTEREIAVVIFGLRRHRTLRRTQRLVQPAHLTVGERQPRIRFAVSATETSRARVIFFRVRIFFLVVRDVAESEIRTRIAGHEFRRQQVATLGGFIATVLPRIISEA